ncbi:MAG: response regulator [Planctomycetes bacterium]|nr:response regulator [Planctomycetota bacterium]
MSASRPPRVLIIEDDADARANLTDILEIDGWQVDTAATAREAQTDRHWADYTAIMLDRRLPDGDGAELLPRLKALASDAAIIMITGFTDLDGAISALRLGAADYILKPVNPDALRASLGRLAERQRVAEALQETEQRLAAVFENALDGIVIADTKGRMIDVNPAACAILGFSRAELLARSLHDLAPSEELPAFQQQWERLATLGKQVVEINMVRRGGAVIDVEYQAVANFLTGLHLLSIRDITSRKKAEERALQAERLAAIGETMAGLVHEGRNALQRSKACLEMLAMEVEDRPDALDLVARAQRAQEDIHRLYEEVRQYAAPIRLQREDCDLRRLWREIWAQVTHLRSASVLSLHEEVAGDPCCEGDFFQLGQVFRNIFENAIQVSPPAGRISVDCQEVSLDGKPAVKCRIVDQGPGMNRQQRTRIFEPFFTTKSKGTGLGMAIAQRIIQSHAGTIEVADRDGPGAEIAITLPKAVP